MSYPLIQFVDAPSVTATVLYDFNPGNPRPPGRWVIRDEISLGVPSLDDDSVDAVDPVYGPRTVSFIHRFGSDRATVLAAMSQLARLQLAGPQWLRYQLAATSTPVWFRTLRAQPAELSLENVSSDDKSNLWDLSVDLPCEPFAYGEKVTQSATTVSVSEPVGTNPMRYALPPVVGDAPTPLRLALTFNTTGDTLDLSLDLHAGATQRMPVSIPVGTGDGLTPGGGVAAGSSDSGATGGSWRVLTPSAGSTMTTRLSGTITVSPGQYRVLLRTKNLSNAETRALYDVKVGNAEPQVVPAVETYGPALRYKWTDLGVHSFPIGLPMSAADYGTNVSVPWSLRSSHDAGWQIALDHILLVPVDLMDTAHESSLRVTNAQSLPFSTVTVIDGAVEDAWYVLSGALLVMAKRASIVGVFPRATPGREHVLTAVLMDYSSGGVTMTASVSYYPRWLYPGDA